MTEAASHCLSYPLAGRFRRLALRCFGDPALPPVVCVHGLTRNARDFDALGLALSDAFHVVSVDLPGRGDSAWLEDPELYSLPTYLTALGHVFAYLARPVGFVGTSLGGLCGMGIAAMPGQPIARMVLNDVGPFLPGAALARIRDYLCAAPRRFPDLEALRLYLRRVHAPFGPLTVAQWRDLARNSARALPEGGLALHYDPGIAVGYAAAGVNDLDMFPWWDAIDVPMLTLRGESSDLLTAELAARMAAKSEIVTVPRTGHAPALLDAPTIGAVRRFLLAGRDRR
jgi:pimeloyl-ACP methyl ester carboxylesterase